MRLLILKDTIFLNIIGKSKKVNFMFKIGRFLVFFKFNFYNISNYILVSSIFLVAFVISGQNFPLSFVIRVANFIVILLAFLTFTKVLASSNCRYFLNLNLINNIGILKFFNKIFTLCIFIKGIYRYIRSFNNKIYYRRALIIFRISLSLLWIF